MSKPASAFLSVAVALGFAGSAPAAAAGLSVVAEDGTKLSGFTEVVSGGKAGVVLVHMLGREASDWRYFAERLQRSGLSVAAVDLRGHGQSARAGEDLSDADYKAMVHDVNAAVAWLRASGVEQVSCAGASIGANLCLQAAAADPAVVNVVALSPGLNYKGVTSVSALEGYGDRPLLLVASEDDAYAAKTSVVLDQRAKGQHHYELLKAAGHGTKMLNRDPGLEGLVLSWLLGTYQLSSGEVVVPRPSAGGRVDDVQTEGQKLDSHK